MADLNSNLPARRSSQPQGVTSKLGTSIFFLIFLAFGAGFACLIGASILKSISQLSWQKVNCAITHVSIVDNQKPSNPNYRCDVTYAYTFRGRSYTGTAIQTDYNDSSNYYDAQKLADHYPAGSHQWGMVDPARPQVCVLERSSLLFAFVLLMPLLFIAIGAGGIFFVWRKKVQNPEAKQVVNPQEAKVGNAAFFSIFFIAGLLVLTFLFIPAASRVYGDSSWVKVPCEILHSGVGSHSGNKGGTTYSVEVLYRYQFKGNSYSSSRYQFFDGSSSGYDSKQDIVQTLPPHHKTFCYVDPTDPAYAVLNKNSYQIFLFGLIPVVFMVVGGLGLVSALRGSSSAMPESGKHVNLDKASPLVQFLVSVGVALFWNGIVSVFIAELISGWRHGHTDYFHALFMIPFVLVGVIIILFTVRQGWKLLQSIFSMGIDAGSMQPKRPAKPADHFRT